MEEIEAKFLGIDIKDLVVKLESLGAERVFEITYRRRLFDFPGLPLANNYSWFRLRDEGTKVTLTFKKRLGVNKNKLKDEGMHEIEVEVSDFDKTGEMLLSIGMIEKFYEENKRIKYIIGDVEFCIDSWPLIPPYLEIEGKSWATVEKSASLLDLNWDSHLRCSTMQIYEHYGINENDFSVLTFEKQVKK
jgi:adenylate cyclase class 2